jgi:hypothetical protein
VICDLGSSPQHHGFFAVIVQRLAASLMSPETTKNEEREPSPGYESRVPTGCGDFMMSALASKAPGGFRSSFFVVTAQPFTEVADKQCSGLQTRTMWARYPPSVPILIPTQSQCDWTIFCGMGQLPGLVS